MNEVEILKKLISFQTNTDFYDNKIREFILLVLKKHIEQAEIVPDTKKRCFFVKIKKIQQSKKRPLVFLCHLDTIVPASKWISNPYHPIEKGDRIIGVGASDMKGSIAAILKAIINSTSIKRDVFLAFTSDEETTVKNIEKLARRLRIEKTIVIAPEPTAGDIRIGQKGILEVKITMPGKSYHASKATIEVNKKDNAIYKMGMVINYTKRQELVFNKEKDDFFESSTINLGKISGGSVVNCVADNCALEISYRLNNTTPLEKVFEEIEKEIKQIDKKAQLDILLEGDSFINTNERDLINLKKIVRRYFEKSSPILGKAWSEVVLFNKQKNSCFILGPGETNQSHKPNEFIKVDNLNKFCRLYSNILEEI